MRSFGFLVLLAIVGCSDPECRDPDEDGFGRHCARGADCDDTNPARNEDCDAVPAPDCETTPESPGCPCFAGTVVDCFLAAPELDGVGRCRSGSAICTAGHYGLCRGYVGPAEETCNGLDDDCDGEVDELVLSPCGGCDPSCAGEIWGPGGIAFEVTPGLAPTGAGAIELARVATPRDAVFFANTAEDTVSHLSASALVETSRHESGGDAPTRLAVDYLGDVFVTNEAPGAQATITKIAGTAGGCVDRDISGTIETSTGPGDVPPIADDECVVFNVPIGDVGELPRAIAVDGTVPGGGDPWVGLHGGEAVLHLDGSDGSTIERIPTPGFAPFSAAFDGRGYLWLASETGELARIDRRESPPAVERTLVDLACYLTHAIAIDGEGAIVATGQNCDRIYRFDPVSRGLATLATLPSPRGIAIDGDDAFVAHTDARVSVLGTRPLSLRTTMDAWALSSAPIESIAIAIDGGGYVWLASAQGGPGGVGLATRFDPSTHQVTHQVPLGNGPRALGDGTGRALRGAYVDEGITTAVFHGCALGVPTQWQRLHVDLDPGTASSVVLDGRWAADEAGLASASFAPIATFPSAASPIAVAFPNGGVVELRVRLVSSARDSSPIVRRIGLETTCIIEIE